MTIITYLPYINPKLINITLSMISMITCICYYVADFHLMLLFCFMRAISTAWLVTILLMILSNLNSTLDSKLNPEPVFENTLNLVLVLNCLKNSARPHPVTQEFFKHNY